MTKISSRTTRSGWNYNWSIGWGRERGVCFIYSFLCCSKTRLRPLIPLTVYTTSVAPIARREWFRSVFFFLSLWTLVIKRLVLYSLILALFSYLLLVAQILMGLEHFVLAFLRPFSVRSLSENDEHPWEWYVEMISTFNDHVKGATVRFITKKLQTI